MKEREIIAKYDIQISEFRSYLFQHKLPFSENFVGAITVDDAVIDEYVAAYKQDLAYRPAQEEAKRAQEEAERARAAE